MKYKSKYPELLKEYAIEHNFFGCTVVEIARLFGVTRDLIYKWMNQYPDFANAVNEVRENISDNVENSLLKKALGYNFEEKRLIRDGVGEDSKVVQTMIIQRYSSPDINSIKYWLNNKRGTDWKEKQNVENSGVTTVYIAEKDMDML